MPNYRELLWPVLLLTMLVVGEAEARRPRGPRGSETLISVPRKDFTRLKAAHLRNALAVVRVGSAAGLVLHREPLKNSSMDRALVLTNNHVAGPRKFEAEKLVMLADGSLGKAKALISSASSADYALLEVHIPRSSLARPVQLAAGMVPKGKFVYALASDTKGVRYSGGKISASEARHQFFDLADNNRPDKDAFVHLADMYSMGGMSGSPVFSADHRMVGLLMGGGGGTTAIVNIARIKSHILANPSISSEHRSWIERTFNRSPHTNDAPLPKTVRSKRSRAKVGPIEPIADNDKKPLQHLAGLFFSGFEAEHADRAKAIRSEDGQIAAFISVQNTLSPHVEFVATNPLFAGRGLGRKLLQSVIEEAKEEHQKWRKALRGRPTHVSLHVEASNTGALSLYRELGFRDVPDSSQSDHLSMQLEFH